VCYVNLCPHHKYSYYIYVSQQEYLHRLLFFDKKIKLGTILVDKSEKYLYNEVKTLREITQYPPLSPASPLHVGFQPLRDTPLGSFFVWTVGNPPTRRLHPRRGTPTRRFHTHIGNPPNTKLMSGLHSICRGGGVALAPPYSHIFIFPHR